MAFHTGEEISLFGDQILWLAFQSSTHRGLLTTPTPSNRASATFTFPVYPRSAQLFLLCGVGLAGSTQILLVKDWTTFERFFNSRKSHCEE